MFDISHRYKDGIESIESAYLTLMKGNGYLNLIQLEMIVILTSLLKLLYCRHLPLLSEVSVV